MQKQSAQTIIQFLQRTQLQGSEAPAMVQVMKELYDIMNAPDMPVGSSTPEVVAVGP